MPKWETVKEENEDQEKEKSGREPITDEEREHNNEEEQQRQMDDMLDIFGSGDDGRRAKETLKGDNLDEPADQVEDEEEKEKESEVEAEDKVEEVEEEELEEEEPEEEKDSVEEEELESKEEEKDGIIEDLRKQINKQAKGTSYVEDTETAEEEPVEEPVEEPTKDKDRKEPFRVTDDEVIPFVSQEDMDNLTSDKMNRLLTKVYNQTRQDSLRDIPELAAMTVQNRMTQQQVVDSYFKENPEILEVREYAGQIANQVQAENPDMDIREIIQEMDKKVRKNLHIKKKAEDIETKRKEKEKEEKSKKKPGFTRKPRGARGGGQEEEATGQQKQINELLPK